MKNTIKEFLDLSTDEKNTLWENCIFVFDTNVLLNLYRYTKKTREILLEALEKLNSRIWMPEHVAYEFMKNRPEVVFEVIDGYDKFGKKIEEFLSTCREELRLENNTLEIDKLKKLLNEWLDEVRGTNLEVQSLSEDFILRKLLKLFDGKVGEPFEETEMKQISQEGKERYEKESPPGYKDAKKKTGKVENNIYGDFIVWKQILRYAKENKRDVIFVTSDQKEDWWLKVSGRTVGPRIELRKEFCDETDGQKFHMYTTAGFLEYYTKKSQTTIDKNVINEVDSVDAEKFYEGILDAYENYTGRYSETLDTDVQLYRQRNRLKRNEAELRERLTKQLENNEESLSEELHEGCMMLRHIENELNEVNRLIYERENKRRIERERSMKQRYYSYAKKLRENRAEE